MLPASRLLHRAGLGALLAALLLAGQARAEDEGSLAHYLPATTPLYVEARNPTLEELKGMALWRMLEDPRMWQLQGRGGEESSLSNMKVPLGTRRGLTIRSDMLASPSVTIEVKYFDEKGERAFRVQNHMAFAWVGSLEGPFPLDLVAALEVDTDAKSAVATLERIAAAVSLLTHDGAEGDIDAELARRVSKVEHGETTISVIDFGELRFYVAPVGKLVAVATSQARIEDMLTRRSSGAPDALSAEARYRRMLEEAPGTGTATTVIALQVDRMLDALQALSPKIGMVTRGSLLNTGLKDLESVTTVARVDGAGFLATTQLNFGAPERFGVARLFEKGPPAKFGGLAFAPKESLYVNCGTFDTAGLHQMFVELAGMAAGMVQGRFQAMFGLRLKEDLLDLLGPELTLIVAPNRGLVPDVAIVCESPDAEKLKKNLLAMLAKVPWPEGTGVNSFTLGGTQVHSVPLGHPKLAQFPIAPTFGVVDGQLVLTLYPLSFQRILGVKHGEHPSLLDNRDFTTLRSHVPKGAQGLSYLDMERAFAFLYDTAIPMLQAMPSPGGPNQLCVFPEADVFTKYVFGRIAWRESDDRGWRWQSYSPLDTSGFALSMLLGAGLTLYYTSAAPKVEVVEAGPPTDVAPQVDVDDEEARECKHNLRLLKARLRLYEQEHGALPDKLEQLEASWIAPETFLVPGTEKKTYVYYGPAGKGQVLLHGYPNGKDKEVTVITKNLRLLRVSEEELQRMLAGRGAR